MISLSCLQRQRFCDNGPLPFLSSDSESLVRLIHREALKEETVAIVVNLMKEQAGAEGERRGKRSPDGPAQSSKY